MGSEIDGCCSFGEGGSGQKAALASWLGTSACVFLFPAVQDHVSDTMLISPDFGLQNWSMCCVRRFHRGIKRWNVLKMNRNSGSPKVWEVGDKGQRSGQNLWWTWGVFPGRRDGRQEEKLFKACFLLLAHRTHCSIFTERNQVMKSYNSLLLQYKKKKSRAVHDWHCILIQSASRCNAVSV